MLSLGRDAASDWLTSAVTTPAGGGSATNLLTTISYSGLAGAAQQPTGASVAGGTYSYAASDDNDLRLVSTSLTRVSSGTTLYSGSRQYDAVGNVVGVQTTLAGGSGGTDEQAFCYDEQNRLTWAASIGASPGGCPPNTPTGGTLTSGYYSQSFGYDNLGRLTSGPLGSSTYGDPAHVHAATSIGSGSTQYTASYDPAGNMLCRAPSGATTCTGSTPSGAQLSYDNEGRLVGWQNAPGGTPTSTASFAYDGEGHRVAEVSSNSATTYYLGGWEEVTGSTVTKYYPVGMAGLPQPVKVGTTLSYLATDGLGSMSEAVDGAGNVLAQQLYAPYGGVRYAQGTLPTSKGFTGQRADGVTGLDYDNARYYDPLAGQFTSADTDPKGGLNRYSYVGDNPETATDPTGHALARNNVQASDETLLQIEQALYSMGMSGGTDENGIPLAVSMYINNNDDAWGLAESYAENVAHTRAFQLTTDASAVSYEHAHSNAYWNASDHMATYVAVSHLAGTFGAAVSGPAFGGSFAEVNVTAGVSEVGAEGDAGTLQAAGAGGCGESFAAQTPVATPGGGEQAISNLQMGDAVEAYDPATGTTSVQRVQRVFVDHDTDLLDVTLRPTNAIIAAQPTSGHGRMPQHAGRFITSGGGKGPAEDENETIHTTASHPWLTVDRGFARAGTLRVGERVRTADGGTAEVVTLRVVSGAANMWDLTVSHVHTFVVGNGRFVVHNCGAPTIYEKNADHIFRNAPGHFVTDTAENRQMLIDTAGDEVNFQGVTRFGNRVYTQTTSDGSQVWAEVRDGQIRDGGMNSPDGIRIWDPVLQRLIVP